MNVDCPAASFADNRNFPFSLVLNAFSLPGAENYLLQLCNELGYKRFIWSTDDITQMDKGTEATCLNREQKNEAKLQLISGLATIQHAT